MTASPLLRLRRWIAPDALGHGWMPLTLLAYLVFLFVPVFMRLLPGQQGLPIPFHLGATVASIALFLPLWALAWRHDDYRQLLAVLGMGVLGLALFAFNPYANTYIIYAAAMAAILQRPLSLRVGLLIGMQLAFVGWMLLLRTPGGIVLFVGAITAVIGAVAFSANHFHREREDKRAQLLRSHDEVRRIAATAERERIGRDLHDLLGHTLSTVALKAELAGKLAARDPAAAKREIDEVATIARDALTQVRTAVSGIRSALIAAELASANVLLEAAGVRLHADIAEVPMPKAVESALAMVLREAATNIERHAHASEAQVTLKRREDAVELCIADNGRGGGVRPGNGIDGMCERVSALGGVVQFPQVPQGTQLRVVVPLEQSA